MQAVVGCGNRGPSSASHHLCVGATAAQALLGRDFRVTQHRGEFLKSPLAPVRMATVHPSSILRTPDKETRQEEFRRFVNDLKKISKAIGAGPK